MMISSIQDLGTVKLPSNLPITKIYMRPWGETFFNSDDDELWLDSISDVLGLVALEDPADPFKCFIMVDNDFIEEGKYHRRPGVHIDGNWIPEMNAHRPRPGWVHVGKHGNGGHIIDDSSKHQKLIMVSSEPYCKVYLGEYDGEIKEGGDCSEIDTSAMESMILEPNHVYMGDAMTLLHETLPATHTSNRALIRINAYATD